MVEHAATPVEGGATTETEHPVESTVSPAGVSAHWSVVSSTPSPSESVTTVHPCL